MFAEGAVGKQWLLAESEYVVSLASAQYILDVVVKCIYKMLFQDSQLIDCLEVDKRLIFWCWAGTGGISPLITDRVL